MCDRMIFSSIDNWRPLKNGNFCSSSRKAKISTTGIYRIFRGLKFEPDAEIGQKVPFCKGLTCSKGECIRRFEINGAEGETRTRTDIHPLDPEPSASTSSATSAH